MTQRDLEHLSQADCVALLRTERVGRLVYVDDDGPLAVPVNFALAGDDIILRVEGGAKRAAMSQPTLAFEVDHIDTDEQSGWSVLIRGSGQPIEMNDVAQVLRQVDGPLPRPWAEGIHNVWLRITPHTVTGRRLGDVKTALVF